MGSRLPAHVQTFGLTGSGLTVGRSRHAIRYDYPGERPWPLTGSTIHFGAVDVSGEAYVDLERGGRDDRARIAGEPLAPPERQSAVD